MNLAILKHRAVLVTAITFLSLLVAAGVRSAPSVLIQPLETSFGWDRATISFTAATGIFIYGLVGPFAAALMLTIGIRRTMMAGLALMALSITLSQFMTSSWQFLLLWGVVSGVGSGAIASVLGAAIVNRWFATNKGLVMGLLSASTATGSLIFLPFMAWLTSTGEWQPVVRIIGLACLALIPLVFFLIPETPKDAHTVRFGEAPDTPPPVVRPASVGLAISALTRATKVPAFWLLFGSFFVCGLTTNGLVGTHLIAYCGDHGIAPVAAAGLLSTMGLFDLIGTTASGWLTDRYDPRKLLVIYYGFRGASLVALPFIDFGPFSLAIFAVFYGLDWIATVPPTLAIANRTFGTQEAPIVFGWVLVGHQIGAAVAAFGAGYIRDTAGSYSPAFFLAGLMGLVAAASFVVFGSLAPHQAQAKAAA
ncbi:MFS transporter [Aestuariivirga litoralis]|uniref:MFS transporter n=1 Tax=Aestuariivirga litoralis TaxID=2650924 RepID=UPI0018C811B1|nr:MFS transporter [Aestuariivirga litoralis]MBG1231495.1 MFS transporter [Aestuariivirga litoralis]